MTPKQIGALLRKAREKRGWTWNRTATESGMKAEVANMPLAHVTVSECPECGQNTLESVPRGDHCTNCGYNVYYP